MKPLLPFLSARRQLLSLWCCAVACSGALGADLELGRPAPEVTAQPLNRTQKFSLSALRGQVVLINFWATWCVPCKAEMPALQTYYDQHRAQGLEVLAISVDDARDVAEVKKIAATYGFAVALKSDASYKSLGRIWRMPSTFVIDREGLLRKNGHVGDAEITLEQLESLVTPLLRAP